MVEQSDRLALIARAGKRLRNLGADAAASPQLPSEPSLPVETAESGKVQNGRAAAVSTSDSPLSGLHDPVTAIRLPAAAGTVGLNFAELRRRCMITPDNMRSNLGFEFRSIKR